MTNLSFKKRTPGLTSAAAQRLHDLLKNRYNTVTINFDDVPDNTVINTTYADKGVTFNKITTQPPSSGGPVYARYSNAAETSPNVITLMSATESPGLTCFDAYWGGIEAKFSLPICSVSIDTLAFLSPEALGSDDNRPFMEIYDVNGTKLAEILYPYRYNQTGFGTWQRLSYSSPQANISSIRFSCQRVGSNYTYAMFDTLIYTINYFPPH